MYTVVNSNNVLDELLLNVTLDNTPKCLYRMSQLGIKVDESITQGDPELLFASSYIVECDIDEVDQWCNWLTNIKVENILLGRGSPSGARGEIKDGIFRECKDALNKNQFRLHMQKDLLNDYEEEDMHTLPVLVQFNSIVEPEQCHGINRNGKIIIITNGRPIKII